MASRQPFDGKENDSGKSAANRRNPAFCAAIDKFPAVAGGGEQIEILAAKDLRQGTDGEQEAFVPRGEPPFPVRAQAAVGDDAVGMDVLPEVLAPGVQHHDDAERLHVN